MRGSEAQGHHVHFGFRQSRQLNGRRQQEKAEKTRGNSGKTGQKAASPGPPSANRRRLKDKEKRSVCANSSVCPRQLAVRLFERSNVWLPCMDSNHDPRLAGGSGNESRKAMMIEMVPRCDDSTRGDM
jgi:hypothetical protein